MKEIKRYLESRLGEYSFFFEDLDCGYSYGFNENSIMTSAGCMKLPIAMACLKECQCGTLSLEQKVAISLEDKVKGTGILHEFGEREYSIKELMVAMLIQSDNTAANKIIDMLSMEKINSAIKDIGLKNTSLNRKTMEEKLIKGVNENLTTAFDLSLCWKHLYRKSYLNRENSEMLIDILKRQQLKNKISYYFPQELREHVASKSGDLEGIENDSMLLNANRGNFTFTIMSKNLPTNIYGIVSLSKAGKMMIDIVNHDWNNDNNILTNEK